MNIGLFVDCYTPTVSGVVTSVLQLREGLEQRGHKVVVVTVATPHHEGESPTVYRFPSVPFNSDSGFRLGLVDQRAVNRLVREEQLEIIHTHTEYSLGWAGRRAARIAGLPLVHTAHTMHKDYRHYLFFGRLVSGKMVQRYLALFLSPCDMLVCPSRKAQDYFHSFMPRLRTVVIGNGVCRTRFRPRPLTKEERDRTREALGLQATDKVVIYVGRMGKEKRVVELWKALAPLLRQQPQYKALFVGRGPAYPHLKQAVAKTDLHRQVAFAGAVTWGQMHKLYSIADLFVTASLSEVHPMTLIEASMCGLPIVARRDDGYADLVEEEYNGYLVDSDRQLAERALEILGDEPKRLQFSQNALLLSERFTAETHVEKLQSLYEQVKSCH